MARESSGCLGKLIEIVAIVGTIGVLCNKYKEEKPIEKPTFFPMINRPVEKTDLYSSPQRLFEKVLPSYSKSYNPNSSQNRNYGKNPLTEQEIRQNAPVFHY